MEALFINGQLNEREFAQRLEYWVNYAQSGATYDVEQAVTVLKLLTKAFKRHLERQGLNGSHNLG